MSVKTVLPILGVGSAVALIGLAAARRHSNQRSSHAEPRFQSGVHPRLILDEDGPEPAFTAEPLTREFWDATPESAHALSEHVVRRGSADAYDSLDTEDLTAAWLARATQAPSIDELDDSGDFDDPAEIAADSMSMISDASRHAAAYDPEEAGPASEYEPASELPPSEIDTRRG